MKTEAIYKSKSNSKLQEYKELATELHKDTAETASMIGLSSIEECAEISRGFYDKVMSADCEYTAYVNCLSVEAWNKVANDELERQA